MTSRTIHSYNIYTRAREGSCRAREGWATKRRREDDVLGLTMSFLHEVKQIRGFLCTFVPYYAPVATK